jgi:hypothetical protein
MSKRGLFVLAVALIFVLGFIMGLQGVCASQGISVVDIDSTHSAVYITNPNNIFAYEIGFDITVGSTNTVSFANFFGAITTTRGSALDGSDILTVYESILGNGGAGITRTGSYNLFNVTHSGILSLRSNLFIANSKSEDSPAICGNDDAETGEDCDGSDVPSSCIGEGYVSGTLGCADDCTYDASGCLNSDGTPGPSSGGGAAAGAVNVSDIKISASPDELIVSVGGKEESRTVVIKNNGAASIDLTLSTAGLNAESTLDKTQVTLAPGRSEKVTLTFRDLRKGLYAGKILVKYQDNVVKEVPIIVNMRSENFLFDSKISFPEGRYVLVGENLVAKINLKEVVVQKEPVDVTINYLIKGFDGSTYFEESETFAVLSQKNYIKNFTTLDLPLGNYVLGIEVVYPGAFATSTAQFSVVTEKPSPISFAVIVIAAMIIIVIGVVVWANKRKYSVLSKRKYLARRK